MKYFNITVNVSKREAYEVSGSLFLSGAESVTETADRNQIRMTALVREDIVDDIKHVLLKYDLLIEELRDKNWVDEWIAYFESVKVENVFTVVPYDSGNDIEDDGSIIIKIDPRGAFGSGTHPTTYMCLLAVKEEIDRLRDKPGGVSVVDVGTGSGILAIAAEKCGASRIDAFDTESDAVERAKFNSSINNADKINYCTNSIESFAAEKPYDIVIANLQSFLIEKYFSNILDLAEKDGVLILSGIYGKWKRDVAGIIEAHGCSIKKIEEKDEWVCFSVLKNR